MRFYIFHWVSFENLLILQITILVCSFGLHFRWSLFDGPRSCIFLILPRSHVRACLKILFAICWKFRSNSPYLPSVALPAKLEYFISELEAKTSEAKWYLVKIQQTPDKIFRITKRVKYWIFHTRKKKLWTALKLSDIFHI